MSDLHPLIKKQAELDGFSEAKHGPLQLDRMIATQKLKALFHDPKGRAQALQDLDDRIAEQDGSSLRAKSDLVRLRQEYAKAHQALLKAGR
jgi:hypothetical protein